MGHYGGSREVPGSLKCDAIARMRTPLALGTRGRERKVWFCSSTPPRLTLHFICAFTKHNYHRAGIENCCALHAGYHKVQYREVLMPGPITIFVTGPDDVRLIRRAAIDVCDQLVRDYGLAAQDVLRVYDQDTVPPTTLPNGDSSSAIRLLKEYSLLNSSMMVFLFWRSVGPAGDGSTSEFVVEFRRAYAGFLSDGAPKVSVYFRDIDPYCTKDPCRTIRTVLDLPRRTQGVGSDLRGTLRG